MPDHTNRTLPTDRHYTMLDLSERTRRTAIALLNQQLASALDLGLQAKHAHWNVKGPQFLTLHELFDNVADAVRELADDIAERATALGGTAAGTLQAIAAATRLDPYPTTLVAGRAHLKELATGLAGYAATTRAAIGSAEHAGDPTTADVFTSASRRLDKLLWLVETHLHDEE